MVLDACETPCAYVDQLHLESSFYIWEKFETSQTVYWPMCPDVLLRTKGKERISIAKSNYNLSLGNLKCNQFQRYNENIDAQILAWEIVVRLHFLTLLFASFSLNLSLTNWVYVCVCVCCVSNFLLYTVLSRTTFYSIWHSPCTDFVSPFSSS